jgi:AraC-like DNA-binding protein
MEIRNLYQPFELEYLEVEEYRAKEHKNTFFEMVFVLEGRGIQSINDHQLPYSSDKLFLISPKDKHGFEVDALTRLFFIRFNDIYLRTQRKEWVQKLEFIFHNHNHLPGCILKNVTDKPLVRAMVEALIRENTSQHSHSQEVIRQLINTVLMIAARNITLAVTGVNSPAETDNPVLLLNYIHQHIYQPEELKAEKMARRFNIAPTYISEYFKTQTGQNMQQYIATYKIRLIEARLRYTDIQLNEIVYEFGFSDASHLNRFFRKHKGVNPSEYRKGGVETEL